MDHLSLRRPAVVAALAALAGVIGCSSDIPDVQPLPVDPGAGPEILSTASRVERIDLLLAVDGSRSMADKQQIFAEAVPDLVRALVNPRCVDPAGASAAMQPAGPLEACPPGTTREMEPILDLHVGIVSSSLGGRGSDACQEEAEDDRGRLVARGPSGAPVETYEGKGFLAWDPAQTLEPPGEADSEQDSAADPGGGALAPALRDMVLGVGQLGCGFEAQLESWYRFLVDPEPSESIVVEDGIAIPQGIDQVLLSQRADFLRPDSLLAIVVVSDENDCSIREGGQYFYAAQRHAADGSQFLLPAARSECALDPSDPCCRSCGQGTPDGCPDDPSCQNPDGSIRTLDPLEDHLDVRCFDQKRRFGIDFLYPIDRYVTALTSPTVPRRDGELAPNPIFSDLDPLDDRHAVRDPSLVLYTAIVGVPWQDLARRNEAGAPDLLAGLDAHGAPVGGLMSPEELGAPFGSFASGWDILLGDPEQHVPPADPHMIPSIDPRAGANPITGDAIAPPGAASGADPISGHEQSMPGRDDLQPACIFSLPPGQERDCSSGQGSCDCPPGNDSPLCEPNPDDGGERTLQVRAKASPGIRELHVARELGPQAVVASACPAQLDDPGARDHGYRPAVAAILARIQELAGGPACLPRRLEVDEEGRVACVIIEASPSDGACACPAPARRAVTEEHAALVERIKASPAFQPSTGGCFCEVEQLAGEELAACQQDPDEPVTTSGGGAVHGYCYVDAMTSPPTGNPEVVRDCPPAERRMLRFVGDAKVRPDGHFFIECQGI